MELNIYKNSKTGQLVGYIQPIDTPPDRIDLELHRTLTADTVTYINGTDEADQVSDMFLKFNTAHQVQKLNVYQISYIQITNVYKAGPDITSIWKLEGHVIEHPVE